jgi:hypothetical protein
VCPAQANRTHRPVAVGKREAVSLAINGAPRTVAGFAVFVAVILYEHEDFEFGSAGKRHTVFGDVRCVKFDFHDYVYTICLMECQG